MTNNEIANELDNARRHARMLFLSLPPIAQNIHREKAEEMQKRWARQMAELTGWNRLPLPLNDF